MVCFPVATLVKQQEKQTIIHGICSDGLVLAESPNRQ